MEKLLERRIEWAEGVWKEAICKDKAPGPLLLLLCDKANNYGRLAFVRETIKRAGEAAEKEPVTAEAFAAAIAQEVESR